MYTRAILLSIFLILSTLAASADTDGEVRDMLIQRGFPAGLFPKGVQSLDLDSSTGQFRVTFTNPQPYCFVKVFTTSGTEAYIWYSNSISGKIGIMQITFAQNFGIKIQGLTVSEIQSKPGKGLYFLTAVGTWKLIRWSSFDSIPNCAN